MSDFTDWKDTLTKEPDSGKKYYAVGCETASQWQHIDSILKKDGSNEEAIPSESIECPDSKAHSQTRAIYLLTDEQAAFLKNHPQVKFVNISQEHYPGTHREDPSNLIDGYKTDRYSDTVYNYRNATPPGSASNELEQYRVGYQIKRVQQKEDPWEYSTINEKLPDRLKYYGDGSDVDIIVGDTRCWFGHEDFLNSSCQGANANPACTHETTGISFGPDLNQGMNAMYKAGISTTFGYCDVLDLVLDAPYYIDPDYFNADPSRTIVRWDGTTTAAETPARLWWSDSTKRSAAFAGIGEVSTITTSYTRANCNGDPATDNATGYPNYHGTSCAAQAYGKTSGWAFNANKWFCNIIGTSSCTPEEYYDMIKLFHLHKPNRKSDNTKNPTVSSNSWGSRKEMLGSGYYYFRAGTDGSAAGTYYSSYPAFMANFAQATIRYEYEDWSATEAGKEMIDAGVIFVCSSGNTNQKLVKADHADYNNYYASGTYTPLSSAYDTSGGVKRFNTTSRQGYPGQIGKTGTGSSTKYRTIPVGALDEDMQSIGGGNYLERKANYSNMGNLVSHYSPGRNTLASSSSYGTVYARYRSTYESTEKGGSTTSSATSYDRKFGGTSSACPTSAGLIATKLQYNRGWTVEDVLSWIEAEVGDLTSSELYIGTESSTATDSNWADDYSLEGGPPRILWDAPSGGEPSESITMSGVAMDGDLTIDLQT